MSERITMSQLVDIADRYKRALELNGITGEYVFTTGSKTNGVAYRLHKDGYSAPGTIGGYLGMTKKEAADTLYSLALMAEDIHYHRTSGDEAAE